MRFWRKQDGYSGRRVRPVPERVYRSPGDPKR
jgi:hypothetical protein